MLEITFPWPEPRPICWNFLDWADIKDTGVSLGLNALYVVTLERAAALERLAGDPALGEEDQRRAARVRQGFDQYCTGDGFYPDTLVRGADGRLTPSAEMSESTQYLVLWAGLASPERTAKLWARLRDAFQPTPGHRVQPIDGLSRAGFYTFPERLDLAVRQGDGAAFLRDLKLMFQPMVESAGTLWETPWADASLCHGLGSMAAAMLTEKTLGLGLEQPLTIAPRALGDLTWCRGYRTLPQGRVSVEWTRTAQEFVLKAELPGSVAAQVVLPEEARKIWQAKLAQAPWPERIPVRGSASIRVRAGALQVE
jgi:hypothetical protein